MANMTFNTRLKNRYDTYEAWKSANPTLLEGEIAVVEVAAATENVNGEAVPAMLIKVGDGETAFNSLPFLSAYAADVYDWAKADKKPEYAATEITGLADFISGKVQDTDTQYKLEQDATDKHILKLYSKNLGGAWSEAGSITTADTVYDDSALTQRVGDLEQKVGTDTVSNQIDAKINALDLANTYEPKGTGATEAAKVQGELNSYKSTNDAAVQAAASAAAVAQGAVDALSGTHAADKAELEGKINLKAAQADMEAIAGRVTTAEGAITTLNANSTTVGSVDYKIAQAVANIMENPDETMNSINELVTWCNDHAGDALELSNQVSANKDDIAELAALVGNLPSGAVATDIVGYIGEAIAALKIGDYAKASDLANAVARIATLEGKAHEHTNKTELDLIVSGDKAKWDAAAAKAHEHANSAELAKIVSGDVEKWNKAQENAEATAASALNTAKQELNAEIAKKAATADLAAVAFSGNINDLVQTAGDYIILNGGKANSWT